ncbi:hypothetical protein [Amycolatopsis sp. lyj-108]|uniref:hypothetical protein n=1 Tax=Amycolatopsis sp. lyj-108 TaxID=2789286 RepID=UPI0039781709
MCSGHTGVSQPNPQWGFRPVKRFPLIGEHTVAALVELVPDTVNAAEVLVAAELEHRSWEARAAPEPGRGPSRCIPHRPR